MPGAAQAIKQVRSELPDVSYPINKYVRCQCAVNL